MSDKSISFYKLQNIINAHELQIPKFQNDGVESFHVISQYKNQDKFIEPFLSEIFSTDSNGEYDVILICAPGATGKTMLSNELSRRLQIPVLNLTLHDPVASFSLTGVLTRTIGNVNFATFAAQLSEGHGAVIIDGLDEGFLKTTDKGYYSFLDDVISFAKDAVGVPFVMLGRTNIVENTALYLDSEGLKVMLAQIEPFTEDQARDYIDKHVTSVTKTANHAVYEEARDYVISTLEVFFKNQAQINRAQFEQFIGYAPVLNAIATLFNKHRNYQKLLEDLRQGNYRNIDLLIEIVMAIMQREKEDKIIPNLLEPMLANRSQAFKDDVLKNAYSVHEQCARLIGKILKEPVNTQISDDPNFNNEYNKKIISFADEHPFLNSGKIQNVVFQSFIIATMINDSDYKELVYRYLKQDFNSPYPLFDIYNKLSGSDPCMDLNFIPYIFSSLQSLDNKTRHASLEVSIESDDNGVFSSNVVFTKPGSEDNDNGIFYKVDNFANQKLSLLPQVYNMDIHVPCDVEIPGDKIEFKSHVIIDCHRINCSPSEILLSKGEESDNIIKFICDEFDPDYSRTGNIDIIQKEGDNDLKFEIISANNLVYPFIDYHKTKVKENLPSNLLGKFHKLKTILGWFRSHSKGDLARYKDFIDNIVVGSSVIGKSILRKLLDRKILYVKESKYFIDNDKMDQILGASRDDLTNGIIPEKVRTFLSELD